MAGGHPRKPYLVPRASGEHRHCREAAAEALREDCPPRGSRASPVARRDRQLEARIIVYEGYRLLATDIPAELFSGVLHVHRKSKADAVLGQKILASAIGMVGLS
jgi:hypothetical protein